MIYNKETIVALATAAAPGAIAIIRVSGPKSLDITNKIFYGKDLLKQKANTIHFGIIKNSELEIVDEVLVSVFKAPYSYTKEDAVEISCHGSLYIANKIIELLIDNGAKAALPGEFTKRAFLNGRFDLAQAEYVSELINSDSKATHNIAIKNMRGGFSQKIKKLRDKLLNCTSMLELELDFGEEDVVFIDRIELQNIIKEIISAIDILLDGVKFGNVFKSGVSVVIAGKPNTGKSTLLNTISQEERSIVSDIPGTTRDYIDEYVTVDGIKIRITDTAGIRNTQNEILKPPTSIGESNYRIENKLSHNKRGNSLQNDIESIGIERSFEKMKEAFLILHILDLNMFCNDIKEIYQRYLKLLGKSPFAVPSSKHLENSSSVANITSLYSSSKNFKQIIKNEYLKFLNRETKALHNKEEQNIKSVPTLKIGNKIDSIDASVLDLIKEIDKDIILISASKNINIDLLKESILKLLNKKSYKDRSLSTNMRHYDALLHCKDNLEKALEDLHRKASSELIASNIRNSIKDIGEITGEITTDNILDNIFSKFCIGK